MTMVRPIGRWLFIAATVAALLSTIALLIWGRWENALRFAVITGVMLTALRDSVPAVFAGPFAAFLLIASWASVQHWYRGVDHLDLVIHFFTPGSIAAVAYFLLAGRDLLPDVRDASRWTASWAVVLWTTMVGTTIAVVWEYYEWVVEQLAPQGMIVGYGDTVADLAAGMAGSAVAGVLVRVWANRGDRSRQPAGAAASSATSR